MAEDVGRFHGAFWKHGQLKNQVVCGGNSDVCNVWFEAWTRGVADNPGFIDTLVAGVQDNKNLPKNGGAHIPRTYSGLSRIVLDQLLFLSYCFQ